MKTNFRTYPGFHQPSTRSDSERNRSKAEKVLILGLLGFLLAGVVLWNACSPENVVASPPNAVVRLPPPVLSADHTKVIFKFPVAAGALDFAEYPINKKKWHERKKSGLK